MDGNGKHVDVPYGKITDLPAFTDSLLDQYAENDLLTWHDGVIPEDEIWVKLGGDHGKQTFKLTLQIANTLHPN